MPSNKIIQFTPPTMDADTTLLKMSSSELLAIMEDVHDLQVHLRRISTKYYSKSNDAAIIELQSGLAKIGQIIVHIMASRNIQNSQKSVHRWENEGGNFK